VLEFPGREEKPAATTGKLAVPVSLREATRSFEREFLHRHLAACRWNRTRVASLLGIQRKTLYLKMRQLDLLDKDE